MTNLSFTRTDAAEFEADAIIIGVLSGDSGVSLAPGAEAIDRALDGKLTETLETLGAEGKAGEITKLPALGRLTAPLVVATGLGDSYYTEGLRRAAGVAARALAGKTRVAFALPAATDEEATAVAVGALLGNYAFHQYRTGEQKSPVTEVAVVTGDEVSDETAQRATILAEAVALTRDLVNTPPGDLRPPDFAGEAERLAAEHGLEVEVLDDKALREGGYGGLTGVGQGSSSPPQLVRLAYRHPSASTSIAFVGKGITFDSGGLSLKPATAMEIMKSDMGGAAAVLSALTAIARLRPAVNVIGYLCLAENMPSGTAQRPSDVLTTYGGKTVEVLNTDAEGRLVLADGIGRAAEDEPDLLVDIATLTGAQIVALGSRTTGVMGDDETRDRVTAAATRAGEAVWAMPIPEELRKGLDSTVADIANVASDRWGGMLTAAAFLREFVPDGLPWAHLDIAGPSYNERKPFGYTPKGGTGAGTRALIQIAEDAAAGTL